MAADVAERAQQPETSAATRKRGRPKASAELQAPTKRLQGVSAPAPPTWASANSSSQHTSAFRCISRCQDGSMPQSVIEIPLSAHAQPGLVGSGPEAGGAVPSSHADTVGAQQLPEARRSQAADAARHGQDGAQGMRRDGVGQSGGVQAGHARQVDSSAQKDPQQGRLFGGIGLRGDAELMSQFDGVSADAKKVLYMASKLGTRSNAINKVAVQLKQRHAGT